MAHIRQKSYSNVSAMLNEIAGNDSPISTEEFERFSAERKLVKDLAILRSREGLSQEELAKQIGRSQSWVSKFEHGTDDEVSLGDLKAYMSALGLEFRPGAIKQGATLVDEIKLLAFATRQKLITLAHTAKEGDGLAEHIAKFFAEAFHNLNRFLSDAAARLPLGPDKMPYISIVAALEEMDSLESEEESEEKPPVIRRLKGRNANKQAALS